MAASTGSEEPNYDTATRLGSNTASPQSTDLSFGIELEYIYVFAWRTSAYKNCAGDPTQLAIRAVHANLSEPMGGRCATCHEVVAFTLPLLNPYSTDFDLYYREWTLIGENLRFHSDAQHLGTNKNMGFTGLELRSRILGSRNTLQVPAEGSDHVHEIPFEEEIAAVLRRLQEIRSLACSDNSNIQYLYANHDCGLHIHVGNYDKGFDLDTVKKLLCLNIACERLIDSIHAPTRIDGCDYLLCSDPAELLYDDIKRHWLNEASNMPLSAGFVYRAFRRRHDSTTPVGVGTFYPESHSSSPGVYAALRAGDVDSWMTLVRQAPNLKDIESGLYPVNS